MMEPASPALTACGLHQDSPPFQQVKTTLPHPCPLTLTPRIPT